MVHGPSAGTTASPKRSKGRRASAAHGPSAPEELHLEARTALLANDLPRAREAIERLGHSLEIHFALEDRVYFPALATLRPDLATTLQDFREEHDRMLDAMRGILSSMAGSDGAVPSEALEALDDLVAGFLRHEGREEALLGALERREER